VNPRADPLRLLNERLVTNRDPDSGFPLSNSASPNSIGYPSLIVKHAIEDVEPIAFHARFDLRSNGASGFRDRLATLVRHPVE